MILEGFGVGVLVPGEPPSTPVLWWGKKKKKNPKFFWVIRSIDYGVYI
jgi:hypothetical protein